jgi:hypothetical protein
LADDPLQKLCLQKEELLWTKKWSQITLDTEASTNGMRKKKIITKI